jgi:hypothetical protein
MARRQANALRQMARRNEESEAEALARRQADTLRQRTRRNLMRRHWQDAKKMFC